MFWNHDLHLSKTGYQKFPTLLLNFISSCNTPKSTSFDLRKIDKLLPPQSKTNIHLSTKKNIPHFKNISFVSLSIFINHLYNVYMFVKFLYLYLLPSPSPPSLSPSLSPLSPSSISTWPSPLSPLSLSSSSPLLLNSPPSSSLHSVSISISSTSEVCVLPSYLNFPVFSLTTCFL